MAKKFMQEDTVDLKQFLSLVIETVSDGFLRFGNGLEPYAAWIQASVLESKAKECKDRRKRNRYFRKAKRLKAQYPR